MVIWFDIGLILGVYAYVGTAQGNNFPLIVFRKISFVYLLYGRVLCSQHYLIQSDIRRPSTQKHPTLGSLERMESENSIAKDIRHAHPWLSFFQRPIPASEWTAPVLHSFCEQREGLRLLLDLGQLA